jgi:predicted phage tail protein
MQRLLIYVVYLTKANPTFHIKLKEHIFMKKLPLTLLASSLLLLAACDQESAEADAKSLMDQASEMTEKAADTLSEKTEKAVDATKEFSSDVADKTADIVDKSIDKTKEVSKDVADKTSDIVDDSVETTKEVAADLKDKTADMVDKSVEKTKEIAGKVSDSAKETYKSAKDMMTDSAEDMPSQSEMEDRSTQAAGVKKI